MSEIKENKPQEEKQDNASKEHNAAAALPKGYSVSTYVVSWKWLIGGLLFFVLTATAVGGLYLVRTQAMSSQILNLVQGMSKEADQLKEEKKYQESLKKRRDAANLLNNYNQANPGILEVQKALNDVLEALYKDEGKMAGPLGSTRSKQIMDNCIQIIQTISSDKESLPYKIRLMEVAWDRVNLFGVADVIDRAKEVLRVEKSTTDRKNYEAMKLITMATLGDLAVNPYNASKLSEGGLGGIFPDKIDLLLEEVYSTKPDDVEIASRYALFLMEADSDVVKPNISEALARKPLAERKTLAVQIINDMVSRNAGSVDAYLTRFRFNGRFETDKTIAGSDIDPDLKNVLKIDPKNSEGLVMAGIYALQQSSIAARDSNKELAEERKKAGEEFLKKNIEVNPVFGLGYQYYGDFLQADRRNEEAIKVWTKGAGESNHPAPEELLGRLIMLQIDTKKYDEARTAIASLDGVLMTARLSRPAAATITRIRDMKTLLTARLLANEGVAARAEAEKLQTAQKIEESRRLYASSQKQVSDALQMFEEKLGTFGKNRQDFTISQQSIYARLLPDSLLLIGQLVAEQGKWDEAAQYFTTAANFGQVRDRAIVLAANAFQQCNQPEQAVRLLGAAAQNNPKNLQMVYQYTSALFRMQVSQNNPNPASLDLVEKNLQYLKEHSDEFPVPWVIDIRLIRLQIARANLTVDSEKILKASIVAVRELRKLESTPFPKPEEGKKVYSDDINFLTELAGNYSSLAFLSDFDRILNRLRELPNGGEAAYFGERLNDALQRNDKDGALQIIQEALRSEVLSSSQKQRFVSISQNLQTPQPDSMEKIYSTLKGQFDRNPDSLKPQAFFLLANMALDRGDKTYANVLQGRIEKIEGAPQKGTWWRYLEVRNLLAEPKVDYEKCRELQKDILKFRDNWDMAYLLGASIEEKFFMENPPKNIDDINDVGNKAKREIINSLQKAVDYGNAQPAVWNRLLMLYETDKAEDKAKKLRRDALIRGVALDANTGQFPQPYQQMYAQVYKYIESDDAQNADVTAKQIIAVAEVRNERPALIFSLNLALGKLFFDAEYLDIAKRHLEIVAKRGSSYVFPLATCVVKSGKVNEGFNIILDEIDRTPSSQPVLLPSVLVLLAQAQPGEEVFVRIDRLMERIERGERQTFNGNIMEADKEGTFVPLGTRRLRSLTIRFPANKTTPKVEGIEVYSPSESEDTAPEPAPSAKPETKPTEKPAQPPVKPEP